jgi:hypothetical protein
VQKESRRIIQTAAIIEMKTIPAILAILAILAICLVQSSSFQLLPPSVLDQF